MKTDTDKMKQRYIEAFRATNKLTLKEAESMCYAAFGFSAKEAANEMGISYRTVEKYIEVAKLKLGCFRKGEVVRKFVELMMSSK